MIQAITMFLIIATGFLTGASVFGHEAVYRLAYGALTLMAAMISLTFLWLWARRATPLALGMSCSWAGAASVLGWWWVFRLLDQPRAMLENQALFLFLSLYFAGALLHFAVIQRSFGGRAHLFPLPGLIALGASALLVRLF